eukprot:gb/GFBE01016077.1/.p1 GENE.gb/GFBE01016077.1/~~gb/GFBE01016077.1/.p1  ORF type:complete len:193 (+),score=39.58 gb/GFBE01016077.1/:1-579(+)
MVKRGVDCADLVRATGQEMPRLLPAGVMTEGFFAHQLQRIPTPPAMLPPGAHTPSDSPESDEEMLSVAECVWIESSPPISINEEEAEFEAVTKKIRVQDYKVPPLSEGLMSQASTAAPTPATTPCTSPLQKPAAAPAEGGPKADYSKLSEPELRELLGVVGTDIAVGWEKSDLVAVLEELDKVLPGMSTLQI